MARKQPEKAAGEAAPKPKAVRKSASDATAVLEGRLMHLEAQLQELAGKVATQQDQLADHEERLAHLADAQKPAAPPPPPAPQAEPEPTPAPAFSSGGSGRIPELEAEVEELQRLLVDGEQRVSDLEDTLRNREEELSELAIYNEDLQNRITELESQQTMDAVSSASETHVLLGEMQESNSYLRKVNAHLEETYAEVEDGLREAREQLESLTGDYREQVRMTESLARELAHTHRWLDEAEVVLDALSPPPPALASPIRRLRQTLQELRDGKLPIVDDMDRVRNLERQLAVAQQDLIQTRQRLLQAHADQDARRASEQE